MRRTQVLALAFYVTAAAAGAALGITVDRWLLRERIERQWGDRAMRTRLADDLQMDQTQRIRLDSVLDDRDRQRDSLLAPVRPAIDSLGAATRQRIRQLLTPEQQATYDQMLREREDARRQEKRQ